MQCVCDKPLISSQIQSLACGYIPTFEHQPAMFLVVRLDQSRYRMASRSISDSKVPSSSCANHWLMMLKFIYLVYLQFQTCNFEFGRQILRLWSCGHVFYAWEANLETNEVHIIRRWYTEMRCSEGLSPTHCWIESNRILKCQRNTCLKHVDFTQKKIMVNPKNDLMLQFHIYTSLLSGLLLKQNDSAMSDYHWVNKDKLKPRYAIVYANGACRSPISNSQCKVLDVRYCPINPLFTTIYESLILNQIHPIPWYIPMVLIPGYSPKNSMISSMIFHDIFHDIPWFHLNPWIFPPKKNTNWAPNFIQKEPSATSASRRSTFSTKPPGSQRRRPGEARRKPCSLWL